jgi:hypothetical protein
MTTWLNVKRLARGVKRRSRGRIGKSKKKVTNQNRA